MALTIKKEHVATTEFVSKPSYVDHLQAEPAKSAVSVEKKQSGGDYKLVSSSEEVLSAPQIMKAEEACTVTIHCGKTVNLGNYESARVDISLAVPSAKSDLEDSYKFAVEWVEKKMAEALEGVK